MSSVGLEVSMSRDFNRVDPPRRTPRNATAFPSRNVARATRHLSPTPRPIACSHGSPRRRSALAKWDEPKHPNTTKTRRARRSQAIRERCRARASPGKSSDRLIIARLQTVFLCPARTWLHVSYAANSGESRRPRRDHLRIANWMSRRHPRRQAMFVYEVMSRRPISTNMLARTGSRRRSEMRAAA